MLARKLSIGAIPCPLDCHYKLRSLLIDQCKFTNAKRTALLLVFACDETSEGVRTLLFKLGDVMRRDVIALDAMRWMSMIWRRESLDLSLTTYECMPIIEQQCTVRSLAACCESRNDHVASTWQRHDAQHADAGLAERQCDAGACGHRWCCGPIHALVRCVLCRQLRAGHC